MVVAARHLDPAGARISPRRRAGYCPGRGPHSYCRRSQRVAEPSIRGRTAPGSRPSPACPSRSWRRSGRSRP